MELWFLLSLVAAFFDSCRDCLLKWKLKSCSPFLLMVSIYIFATPITVPWLVLSGLPTVEDGFWESLIIAGVFEVMAAYFFVRAVGLSDISLIIPLVSFTPVFLLFWSPLLLDEQFSSRGILGVVLIVFGGYLMNINVRNQGLLMPLKAILRNRGARFMLLAALCWSLLAVFCKKGVGYSSPAFWTVTFCIWSGIIAGTLLVKNSRSWKEDMRVNLFPLIAIGLVVGGTMVTFFTAISLQNAAYVVATKRVSILISVILGYLIFKEENVRPRLLGATVMLFGVVCIGLIS